MRPSDLLAEEKLLITGPQPGAGRRRGVLLFPHSYALGMASLATHTLYAALNAPGEMAWERAFIDPARDSAGAGIVRSIESGALLGDFDVIALTSSFELDWPAIPDALEAGGVPPLRETRCELTTTCPLVIAGGPAISAAPLPLAALYDVAYIGEIEPVLPVLHEALTRDDRQAALERLAEVPGFFVPDLHPERRAGMLARRCARNLDDFETASAILTPHSEFPGRFLVEMGRGCGRSCSFCLARRIYRPLRWRSLPRLMDTIRRGLQHTHDLGLIAAAVSDYPDLAGLCAELAALPGDVSLTTSSVRLESATPELLRVLARGGQQTVTYAPEAATERLRAAIGKQMSDDEIFSAIERAAQAGLGRVRLYFMVGLPTETEADREAIADLAQRLTQQFPRLSFRFNVGAFSPRPHTPFEFEPLPPLRDLRTWLADVQKALRPLPRLEVNIDSAKWATMQAAFSRADERLALALMKHPPAGYNELVASLAAEGLVVDELVSRPDESALLPWKIVDPRCAD